MRANRHKRFLLRGIFAGFVTLASIAPTALASQRLHAPDQVKAPVRTVVVNPVYPEAARQAKIQGIVILQIVIGEDGAIATANVVRSVPELDQAAIDAVLQWRFEPTLLNGSPVEVEMNVTVNFSLS